MCARARTHGKVLAIPAGPLPADADALTRWLDEQFDTFPTLAQGQQAQLAALPLQHDPLALALRRPLGIQAATHAHGLRAARRFYRCRSTASAPQLRTVTRPQLMARVRGPGWAEVTRSSLL